MKEGELTLAVAKLLRPRLERLGAEVFLVRESHEPVTGRRPEDLVELAKQELEAQNLNTEGAEKRSQLLFYRRSEIRERSKLINEKFQPDVTLCLHFNAERWDDPSDPRFTSNNHLHLIINGTYSNSEFSLHDQRLDLFKRLLQRIHPEELAVSSAVADSMAAATGLRPYIYTKPQAKLVSNNRFVYARNLMANRIYHCPIVYLEPYVMNNREVYERIGAGDYDGVREVAGKPRKSIFREYSDGVAEGLANYYRDHRPRTP